MLTSVKGYGKGADLYRLSRLSNGGVLACQGVCDLLGAKNLHTWISCHELRNIIRIAVVSVNMGDYNANNPCKRIKLCPSTWVND